jgi:DNA (cytosine-5)-methyltransferase 1
VAAVENDQIAAKTYRRNLSDHVLSESIEELTVEHLMSFAGIKQGECTLLAGGPPCQGFSVQRRGDRNDPRNSLVLEFIRFVQGIKPQFFLIENVSGLLSKHGTPYLAQVFEHVEKLGYVCHVAKIDAANFGVPQNRLRAMIVGELIKDGSLPKFEFPNANNHRKLTVHDAIADLPSPPENGTCHPSIANHYRETRLSALNIERIKHVPEGGGREHIPEHLQLACHRDNPKHRHLDVYGRLSWNSPSGTITARFDSFTRGRFGHPVEHRSITLREGARLQTFPDNFIFDGNREEVARQIGNAVPPLLAKQIGEAIIAAARK